MDYKYLRWQVIDTPGVLDHPLEEMNTIEMQSITALAHLRSAVLYFMDLSEQCGYTIEAQCKLFHSIKPLFANKPVMLVINKIDVCRLEELSAENRAFVDEIIGKENVQVVQASCYTEEGVMSVRDASCDALLAHRVEQKLRGNRLEAVANKIHVAVPKARDTVERPAFIPEAAKNKKKYDKNDPDRIKLEKEIEQEMEGKAIFSADTRSEWPTLISANVEWFQTDIDSRPVS
jgi:nucleolar GTP-binding protein